ncbi:MAG: transposase [Terracidiphilus sp.]
MINVHRFRLYPSKGVERKLFDSFDKCCSVYNYCLEHQEFKDNVLPLLKQENPELYEVHSIVLQNVVHQLQDNLHVLHALKENGHRVGKLRFKNRHHSMIFEQTGFKLDGDTLVLSKIGRISMKVSQPIHGVVKQVIVKHNKTHKWFACLVCEDSVEPLKATGRKAVGIDLNVSNFCTDSDGLVVEHPRNVKKASRRLAKTQRKFSSKKKGSHNRRKQKTRVALVHERVELRRNDFLHKLSRYYVNHYDLICLEDLNILGLVEINGSVMRKLMLDAGWRKFADFCGYKAEHAGKRRVKVDPKGTTQECSVCGRTVFKTLRERMHRCVCGAVLPRDYNSSLNIKRRGLDMVAWGTCEPSKCESTTSTLAEIKTSILPPLQEQVLVEEARISRL